MKFSKKTIIAAAGAVVAVAAISIVTSKISDKPATPSDAAIATQTDAVEIIASTAEESSVVTTQAISKTPLPASAKVNNVPYINQHELGYPMGCEAASGTMLLNYYGYEVSMAQVVAAVPSGKGKYQVGDIWYAADPFEEFVGSPKNKSSDGAYGCFVKPLAEGISRFAGERVKNISECTVDDLFRHIADGSPVVIWGASNGATLSNGVVWQCVDKEGNPTGKSFQEIKREHCMVLIGYDAQYVYLNDPSKGANIAQEKSLFISNWNKLYCQAIVIV